MSDLKLDGTRFFEKLSHPIEVMVFITLVETGRQVQQCGEMNAGKPIFAQILQWIHPQEFARCVKRYIKPSQVRHFSCWDQFLSMAFAQLTFRESLRDIEDSLRPRHRQLYHLGFRSTIARSTLAEANATRDWRIYRDLALSLIARARELYVGQPLDIEGMESAVVYAIDSTTVDLCLSLFPWARFRRAKGAVKIHTQLDLRGAIPTLIYVTHGKVHDGNWLDTLKFDPGSFYILDRGYVHFERLARINQAGAFFVTRPKSNLSFYCCHSNPVEPNTGVVCDQAIRLTIDLSKTAYPQKLRRIVYLDPDTHKRLVFITNNFILPASTIALLYKARWQIELFFKLLKMNFRIKGFFGREPNAVHTQIWCIIAVYTLLIIIKKRLNLKVSMHTILTVLSVNIFEKVPIAELFTQLGLTDNEEYQPNQLLINY